MVSVQVQLFQLTRLQAGRQAETEESACGGSGEQIHPFQPIRMSLEQSFHEDDGDDAANAAPIQR